MGEENAAQTLNQGITSDDDERRHNNGPDTGESVQKDEETGPINGESGSQNDGSVRRKAPNPIPVRNEFIIQAGSIDLDHHSRSDILDKYEDIISMFDPTKEKVTIIGILPRLYERDNNRTFEVNQCLKQICKKHKTKFIDLGYKFAGRKKLYREDGIRLSFAGKKLQGKLLMEGKNSIFLEQS